MAAKAKGYQVAIAGPLDVDQEDLPQGLNVYSVPLTRGWSSPVKELQSFYALYKLYQSYKPDILHHVTIKPMIYGTCVARWLKIPRVINAVTGMGNLMLSPLKQRLAYILYKLGCRHPQQTFIFQNRTDQRIVTEWLSLQEHQQALIPGAGVDVNKLTFKKRRSSQSFNIMLPARMVWSKGIKEFVEAAKVLKKSGSKIKCILVGGLDQSAVDAIDEAQLLHWQSEGWVEWRGYQESMQAVYDECHVVCLPSYREGISKALLEAMAVGCAVVTCDVAGCNETIEDMKTGLLVPVKNSLALVNAFQTLAQDSDLYKSLTLKARERAVSLFSLDKVIAATLSVYADDIAIRKFAKLKR